MFSNTTRFLRNTAAVALIAALSSGICGAASVNGRTISVELSDSDGRLNLTVWESARRGPILNMLGAEAGGIYLTTPEGTAERIAKLAGAAQSGNSWAVYRCLTDAGRRVDLLTYIEDRYARITVLPVGWSATSIKLVWAAGKDEDFFGGGEVWNGTVNQRGRTIQMWVANGTPDECCYVPFFFSSAGYGIYVGSTERGSLSFAGEDSPDQLQFAFDTKDRQGLTFYYLSGPTPKDVVMNYTSITGRPPLPPKWSFLPWKWRNEHRNWDEVFEDAVMMRKHNIPCSVLWIDNPWMKYGLCSFEFDPKRFPDAGERIRELKKMGYRVMVWVAPFTNRGVPNYQTALEKGYLVKNPQGKPYKMGGGVYIDLTNPEAYNWWRKEMKKVIRLGIDGFKLDRGQDIRDDAVFFDGSTGASMHNGYARLYVQACYDTLREELGDDFTMLPRAGCAGSQAYSPGKWPGDLVKDFSLANGLGSAIVAGQNIALAGFAFWGSDIGGFCRKGNLDTRLLARWAQFGCFSPIMQLGGSGVHEPWNPIFGKEGLAIYRYYATLHSELLPYTYTYAAVAHQTGLPIMRPLVLEFPNDEKARRQSFEYMYGEHMLVAPIHSPEDNRGIYLPRGQWVDYWDWRKLYPEAVDFAGVEFPLDRMPIYLRNGAIIPMEVGNAVTGHGAAYSKGKLTVLALPAGRSHFRMLDGEKAADFWMLQSPDRIKISWKNAPRPVLLRVRALNVAGVKSPAGKPYTRCKTARDYVGKPGTWYHARSSACLLISPRTGETGVLIFTE
ncbi:MAG TPA: TIM-barrel domain-containing protein [Armatimonadota bacterium]|nr:TIM-barrel domain-containing protein [Armatimonadota bacterium]